MRKTAKTYRKEYLDLQKQIAGLEARIHDRLIKIATKNPDAVIDIKGGVEIKAKTLTGFNGWTTSLTIDIKLHYIETIEKWLAAQQPVIQAEINFK
jgi:hypothetical protein